MRLQPASAPASAHPAGAGWPERLLTSFYFIGPAKRPSFGRAGFVCYLPADMILPDVSHGGCGAGASDFRSTC